MSWVATTTAAPALARLEMRSVRASLWARSMPRVGSSSSTTATVAGREHHLERQPLALAAGQVARVGLAAAAEAGRDEPVRAGLLARVLVDQVVARVLEQQRDLARALDLAARRLGQSLQVAQQRRLARAVAAHQRNPLTGLEAEVDAAQDRRAVLGLDP